MNQIEQALIEQCIASCTHNIYETLKTFKVKKDKVLIKYDVEQILRKYLEEKKK